ASSGAFQRPLQRLNSLLQGGPLFRGQASSLAVGFCYQRPLFVGHEMSDLQRPFLLCAKRVDLPKLARPPYFRLCNGSCGCDDDCFKAYLRCSFAGRWLSCPCGSGLAAWHDEGKGRYRFMGQGYCSVSRTSQMVLPRSGEMERFSEKVS